MKNIIIQVVLFIICAGIVLSDGKQSSLIIDIINILLLLICIRALFVSFMPSFSTYKMVHLFFLFFLCLAPALQFKNNVEMIGTKFKEDEYITTYIYVLFAIIIYNVIYWFSYLGTKPRINLKQNKTNYKGLNIKLIIISFAIFFLVFYINNFNIISMFLRGGIMIDRVELTVMQVVFADSFFRPMSMIVLLFSIYTKRSIVIRLILFLLFFITVFPLGVPRYAVAAMYIPVILSSFPFIRKNHRFVLLLVTVLLIAFPILSSFREYSDNTEVSFKISFSQFESIDFDAFSSFMRVVRSNYVTYGWQLLGTLLFWVPRSIWDSKPIPSGELIGDKENLITTNISMCYLGEGYINFGTVGVFVYMIILAIITAKLDSKYVGIHKYGTGDKDFFNMIYYIIVSFIIFLMRGDMMSSFAYLIGYLSSYYFIKKIIVRV